MSRDALEQGARELRTKAANGVYAVMAARDLVALLPKAMADAIEQALDAGALKERWDAELAEAQAEFGDTPEASLAAVTAMLAWQQKLARDIAAKYADKIEQERKALESRADGIEQALKALP